MFRPITSHDEILALVRRLKPAIVSFDLFDTLIYRTVARPDDVFRVQGRRLKDAGLIDVPPSQWFASRKKIERELAKALAPGEVTLEQIYDGLTAAGDLAGRQARDAAMALELEIEREVIRLYSFVPELLKAVKETGARVVVLSDMYLPRAFICELLQPVARWIDEIHCSSQTQLTKRRGHAYALLKTGGKVLHFGDNRRSDRWRAWQNGVDGRLIDWERRRWLRRNRPEVELLRLRGNEVPPLADPARPPAPDTLEALALRWAIVLFDFLLDLRAQARAVSATDIWLASRDCESIWAVLREHPHFMGPLAVRYVRTSRKATYPLMARADPERCARWFGPWMKPVDPQAAPLAERYYRAQLRPETRRILFVDMISRGRLESSLRLALPPDVALSGFYFALDLSHEASSEARVYLPWRHDLLHTGAAIEVLSGIGEGTCVGFRATDSGAVEPVLEDDPKDAAPKAYLDCLRATLTRLIEAEAEPRATALLDARCAVVGSLVMFPDRAVAAAMRGWHYSSRHDHPAGDVVAARAKRIRSLFALASIENRWPTIALHSVAPRWLVPALQWLAVGRMRIKNRLRGVGPLHKQAAQLVGHDDRG